jgi:DNA-binding NtrC family response regulator
MSSDANFDILVVDDAKRIADTLGLIFRSKGYSADCDGAAAYNVRSSRTPRFVISDVVMPMMNGVQLAIRLKTEKPECLVLLFSGQAASADMLQEAKK